MKKIVLLAILVMAFILARPAMAEWRRLREVDKLSLNGGTMFVVYDEVEKVNCYVVFGSLGGYGIRNPAVDCLPVK